MPRSFTKTEKEAIKQRLIAIGNKKFNRFGLKKVSLDEIVRETGIAKGSFYKFFASKEELLFACIEDLEIRIKEKELYPLLKDTTEPQELLYRILMLEFELADKYPLLNILNDSVEFESLCRALPPQKLQEHLEKDRKDGEQMAARLFPHSKNPRLAPVLTGLFRGVLMLRMHKEIIGEEVYPEAIQMMCRSLASGLITQNKGEES